MPVLLEMRIVSAEKLTPDHHIDVVVEMADAPVAYAEILGTDPPERCTVKVGGCRARWERSAPDGGWTSVDDGDISHPAGVQRLMVRAACAGLLAAGHG